MGVVRSHFYIEAVQQNLFGLRFFRRDVHGGFERAAGFTSGGKFNRAGTQRRIGG